METLPIDTLKEAIEWKPPSYKLNNEKLKKRIKSEHSSKVLVCHDMQGGYLDDRYIQGAENTENYRFFHWSNIDIFVYFSHHFITIPPNVWITASHRNGTPVLGTIITEWEKGKDLCCELFSARRTYCLLACQLTAIARFYGFDGWLVNIENTIEDTDKLEEFIYLLTTMMHTAIPNSLVIMYDSVITTGELKWQNELNALNRCFFDACDGIFLNYNWKEDNLKNAGLQAAHRKSDVYVGVDVFGRGCLGGGGFNTRMAVKAAVDNCLSIAVFAPGWIFETLEKEKFLDNQYKFWRLINEFCPLYGPAELPFSTSFCQGFGKKFYRKGKVIGEKPWFNLSLQQIQPSFHWEEGSSNSGFTRLFIEDAYEFGGCLQLCNTGDVNRRPQSFRLFASYFHLTTSVRVSYTIKPVTPNTDITLIFEMEKRGNFQKVYLSHHDNHKMENLDNYEPLQKISRHSETILFPLTYEEENEFNKGISITEQPDQGWITRTYILNESEFYNSIIKNISAELCNSSAVPNIPYYGLLGQIQIIPFKSCGNLQFINLLNECSSDDKFILISCLLQWETYLPVAEKFWDIFCCIDDEKLYLGTTNDNFYIVNRYRLPNFAHNKLNVKFCVINNSCNGHSLLSSSISLS